MSSLGIRRDIAWLAHEDWLEQYRRRKRAHQRQGQQFAHAGSAGVVGKPQAAERSGGGERAEDHGASEARRQELRLSLAPCHDVVDLEGDADAEQQRQRDDIGEIERKTCLLYTSPSPRD